MKPITVATVIDRPREEVFAFLEPLPNHQARERLAAPFVRAWLRRGNQRSLDRLRDQLEMPGDRSLPATQG
jgi:hypothetical protein